MEWFFFLGGGAILGTEPRASLMLGKCSTTELLLNLEIIFCIDLLRKVKTFSLFTQTQRTSFDTCSLCLIKVFARLDYHNTCLPREPEITASCETGKLSS